jgi:hypothetical protein
MGRHSHPDDAAPESAPESESTPAPELIPPVADVRSRTTAVADLQLVLRNRRLLAACVAAAFVPFAVYFIVIVTSHEMHLWALFLGAPLVLAGVLVGAVLDRAYGRLSVTTAPAASTGPTAPAGRIGPVEPARDVTTEVSVPAAAAPAALSSHSVEGAHP